MSEGEIMTDLEHESETRPQGSLSLPENASTLETVAPETPGFSHEPSSQTVDVSMGFPVQTRKPAGYWNDPRNIEQEAKRAIDSGVRLIQKELDVAGFTQLSAAVGAKKYPGGWRGLRENLGEDPGRMRRGYWDDPVNIEREAIIAVESSIHLSAKSLIKAKKGSLAIAIYNKYPGGHEALKAKLGIKEKDIKPHGYFSDIENIKSEAKKALNQGVRLTHKDLTQAGFGTLSGAASREFPGGLDGLKKEFGVDFEQKKPGGFWLNSENIEAEAKKAIEEGIELNSRSLREAGKDVLAQAVYRYYEGSWGAIREKFGLEVSSPEQISPDEADEMMRSFEIE